MTSRIMRSCARDLLGIDTPDDPLVAVASVGGPSAELLDRARSGWERFLADASAVPDE